MDAGQSSQISSSSTSSRDLISPCKGTHTLTVREYEQTIDELKKENFNLKLKLYLYDETHKKTGTDKDSTTPNDEVVTVVVHLTSEVESLRAELKEKENILQDALEKAEKLESDCKKLEKLNTDLQAELTSFSELPSKEEILLLGEEKENCVNHIHSLEDIIKEKEEEIDTLNQKIEILATENTRLDEKIKKRSLAIQGFVYKAYKEKEMLPDDIKHIVISATQAAKNKNKEDLSAAVKSFTSALNKIMSAADVSSNLSKEKENIESPIAKCLSKKVSGKSSDSFLSSQSESPSNIAQVQVLKEILPERNILDSRDTKKMDSLASHSYIREKVVHQNAVNIFEKDIINFCDISPSEENLMSFSERPSIQKSSVSEHKLADIKTVSSPAFCKLTAEKDISESDHYVNILQENEKLKDDLNKKLAEIKDLSATCEELRKVHLKETGSDTLKASQQCCVSTQTKITGRKLLDEYGVMKLEKDMKLSDNVEELRGNIFLLLHTIEEKDKELSEVKQSLAAVQEDLKKALNTTTALDKDFYVYERNEIYERLASSCSINEELLRHLKSLEKFMEDLLHHKFDSSLESITDKTDFISSVSKCLNESLNLSKILSDNLSICEGSRLFEDCESFLLKNRNSSVEKNLPHLGLDRLSILDQSSHCEYISHAPRHNLRIEKESGNNQLCWRCWQQLNPTVDVDQTEGFHLMQSNSLPKPAGYLSSDSDIWSEPDRNVSMQRIGISLQNSPVSSKSPRKFKQKDKRISSKISSKEDTSSSDLQAFRKRQGSASRRLFAKESAKTQDFAFDNFYFLVAEKYSKFKSLMDDLENIKDAKLSDDGWIRINNLLCAVGETLQKLHFAKENLKTSPACGKCIMMELFSKLKTHYVETDYFIDSGSFEQKILQEFSRELCVLKEACKEPFSVFYETVGKKSIATQSDILIEHERIKELEHIIKSLTEKNKKMDENFEKTRQMHSKEKEDLFSVKAENSSLLNEIDNLKIDLVDLRYREKELLLKNEKLSNELIDINKNNVDLNNTIKNIEQQKKESSNALNKLNAELERTKSDLIQLNERCLELEKQLSEQTYMKENCENRLKNLEAEFLREKKYYLGKIDDLTAEKYLNTSELKILQEKRLTLEKENAVINDRLQSKSNELSSLKCTLEKLQNIKGTQDNLENAMASAEKVALESVKTENLRLLEEINKIKEQLLNSEFNEKELSFENKKLTQELDHARKNNSELNNRLEDLEQNYKESISKSVQLKAELEKYMLDFAHMNNKCQILQKKLDELIQIKEKYENELKTIKLNSLSEKESLQNQLNSVNAENKFYEQEIKNFQEKILILEKENATKNLNLSIKNTELSSLKKTVERCQSTKEVLTCDHEETKLLSENNESSSFIKPLKEELSHMKMKEKEELLYKNEKLIQELACLNKNNLELNNTLNDIDEKNKNTLDQLTAELQKTRSDLIHMNEKCIEYEKQLNEQIHLRENSESKLKNLEYESQTEKNYYLHKIDDLNAERNQYILELKAIQEQRLALEKENAVINERLQSKNNELLSLKGMLDKLQCVKDTQNDIENEADFKEKVIYESVKTENIKLSNEVSHLKEQLLDLKFKEKEFSLENKKLIEDLNCVNKNYSELNSTLEDLKMKYKESTSTVDQLKTELEKTRLDLSYMNEKCETYEKRIDNLNSILKDSNNKNTELNSTVVQLRTELHKYKSEKNCCVQELENIKTENLKLLNNMKQVKEELSLMQNKEKEFYLKNEKLIEELNKAARDNAKLNDTLNILEKKRKDSTTELNQLAIEVQKSKSDLLCMSEKCLEYEKRLNEQTQLKEKYEKTLNEQTQLKEKYEKELKSQESKFLNEITHYSNQINKLNAEKENYVQQLEIDQEKKLFLEKEIATVNNNLQSKNNELLSLQKAFEELQKSKETLNSECKKLYSELISNQECLTNVLEKHKKCEETINKSREVESDYCKKLEDLKAKSISEKEELLNEISVLTKERDDILQTLKDEKETYKRLKSENTELNEKYMNVIQQISTLKQRNEFFENALLSSNKECDSLSKDLKCLRNTLQNLESKCVMYEKQIVATVGIKDSLTECLLNINNEFSIQRQKLNEMCKLYGNDDSVVWDETFFTKFTPIIDDDNVSKLCESVVLETKKLSQSIDKLISILKNYHVKFVESKTSEEKNQTNAQSLKKQIELNKAEVASLHLQNDHFQHIIGELQKSISEREESLQNDANQIEKLKEKLQNSQKEIDKKSQLVERKDDEITKLQERIFDLQTFVNNIMTDKKNMLEKSSSMTGKTEDIVSSNNQLSSKLVLTDSKMCQTEEWEYSNQNLDESFTSVSSVEFGKNHCCEKYWKKCYSLQTKLALCQKHIEILEKSKNDLKERLLQQLQNKKDSDEKSDSAVSKLIDLESKLEKKKLFINELKSELLKTCNSLIDKEKEVDDLKQKLSDCEVRLKCENATQIQPITTLSSVDANVKTLKNHKWRLIQTIFGIQRKFYEKKGIHLNYFDKFKDHVNNLYSLQLIPSMSKSESMPLLRSYALREQFDQGNEKIKKLADLELDIECLENLKIFLNRFLVPHVFQAPETSDKETDSEQKVISSDSLSSSGKIENHRESKHKISDILNLSFPEAFIATEKEKELSIGVLASAISQHLDYIENFLNVITKINWLDIQDLTDKDSVGNSEVKSLLLKIFHEINIFQKGADKLFNFSTQLKSLDFVTPLHAPLSTTKLDTSDRESIMSEETIAVSRTESPLSFEDTCPIKLPHPDTLQLEENTVKTGSVGNRIIVVEPYGSKTTIVGGSYDSVCQRSHYSSPDLGIESDPNHDSSAPEHKEDDANKYKIFPYKLPQAKTTFTSAESAGRWPGPTFGDTYYAISTLPQFELLKQEIKESLVAIKSVLSRTGDGLHHIAKYTSPRKTLEYNTLKSIKDTCVHMEVCLKEANNLVSKFWTAPCPTEKEWKMLKEENQKLSDDLVCLRALVEKQEIEFKKAMGTLQHAQAVKDNIEKKISKKLVKTKKLIRQAEFKLLKNTGQNYPPVPKYSSEQTEQADAH